MTDFGVTLSSKNISNSETPGSVSTIAASHKPNKENKLLNKDLLGQKQTATDGDHNEKLMENKTMGTDENCHLQKVWFDRHFNIITFRLPMTEMLFRHFNFITFCL